MRIAPHSRRCRVPPPISPRSTRAVSRQCRANARPKALYLVSSVDCGLENGTQKTRGTQPGLRAAADPCIVLVVVDTSCNPYRVLNGRLRPGYSADPADHADHPHHSPRGVPSPAWLGARSPRVDRGRRIKAGTSWDTPCEVTHKAVLSKHDQSGAGVPAPSWPLPGTSIQFSATAGSITVVTGAGAKKI